MTNATGGTCFEADYYPYGQENDYNTSCSPTYKFTGYEYDSETSNYYAFARYYSPRLGRFMSTDPLGGSVGAPQSQNRYTYSVNNPTTFVDPAGLCKISPDGTQWIDANQPPPCPPLGQYISVGTCIIFVVSSLDSPSSPPTSLVEDLMGCGDDNWSGFWNTTADPEDTTSSTSQPPSISKVLTCASETANTFSLAGLIDVNAKTHPVGAAITNGFLGNTLSGTVDAGSHMASFLSAATFRQKAFAYAEFSIDLALGGAGQGIPGIAANNVWGKGIAGTATDAAIDAMTAARPVLSLTGEVTDAAAQGLAGPIGWGKLAIDGLIFLGSAAYCAAGN